MLIFRGKKKKTTNQKHSAAHISAREISLLKVILKLIVHGAGAPLQIFGTQRSPSGCVDISTKVESRPKKTSPSPLLVRS